MTFDPNLLTATAVACRAALDPHLDADWSTRAADLDWSCRDTVVHVIDDCIFYAVQLVQRRDVARYVPVDLTAWDGAATADLLDGIDAGAELLRRTVIGADPGDRGYHTYGISDPGGFAAMGVVETLIHSYDIDRAFGGDWTPPDDLAAAVLARLFRDAPSGGTPSEVLLYCCGRTPLGDLPRRTEWRWDGTVAAVN